MFKNQMNFIMRTYKLSQFLKINNKIKILMHLNKKNNHKKIKKIIINFLNNLNN